MVSPCPDAKPCPGGLLPSTCAAWQVMPVPPAPGQQARSSWTLGVHPWSGKNDPECVWMSLLLRDSEPGWKPLLSNSICVDVV